VRRVAVTGVGVVSPIGTGVEAFFGGLREATSGIDRIRAFDASAFPTQLAAEVRDLDLDAIALPEEERALLGRDPKSLFGLAAAREALADAFGAARAAEHLPAHRVACMVASGLEIFHLPEILAHMHDDHFDAGAMLAQHNDDAHGFALQLPADTAARCIAREAGAAGLFSVNVSACAAGTQALGEAWLAIRDDRADAVICGGYDSMVNPLGVGGFCMLEAMSQANELGAAASRPFDVRRDGFVLGEGAGFFVFEELEAARARGAHIHAEVLGYASTLDAYRVTDPPPDHAQAVRAMQRAIAEAGLTPGDVDYINAHGTATPKNDPAEALAIRTVFGDHALRVPVSSTKSQIGHLIGAAGAVELCAGLFALERGLLPATINLDQPDPECQLNHVARSPRPAEVKTFLSNSFGFGGQNACIVAGALRD